MVSFHSTFKTKSLQWMGQLLIMMLLGNLLQANTSESVSSEHTTVTLLSSTDGIKAGKSFFVALHMEMKEGWHTYHKEPGDAGFPTSIEWQLPEGITAGEIIWPTPIEFETTGIQSFGYEGNVYLRIPMMVSPNFTAEDTVKLVAAVSWLECKDICIPGEAVLTLELPISEEPQAISSAKWSNWDSLDESKEEKIVTTRKTSETANIPDGPQTVLAALALAFGGGLILNLMPCVFPVLGIKVLGFVNQSGNDYRSIRLHGIVFTLGVLISFWLLVSVLLALRTAGEELGWGFQLQNPLFIAFLIVVFFLFSLNLLGVFEFGLSLTSVGSDLSNQSGLQGAFFSGALTTIVATPCTAPFMGSAISFALNQPFGAAIAVFTALAIGLASPYLLLSFFPQWIEKLPRPGAWMDTLKQFFAFPMLATVLWLIWVFGHQTSIDSTLAILAVIILLSFGTWILGSFAHRGRSSFCRFFAYSIVIAIILFSIRLIWNATQSQDSPLENAQSITQNGITWERFSPERIYQLRQEGYQVYVDFTAKWCTQCLSNKKVVFNSPGSKEVLESVKETNTILMVADWTKRDPMITAALQDFGRAGVPLNVVYPANLLKDPIVLPSILSQQTVIRALRANDQ